MTSPALIASCAAEERRPAARRDRSIPRRTAAPPARLVGALLGVAALAGAPPAEAQPGAGLRGVRVHLVDSVGLPEAVRNSARHEIERVWSAADVHVVVAIDQGREQPQQHDRDPVYVLLRDQAPWAGATPGRAGRAARREGRGAPLHGPSALAWTPIAGGRPGSVIFVSVTNARRRLNTYSYAGWSFPRCPKELGDTLLGRALGRVVAHEIGHVLYGAAHAREGLMKPRYDNRDLLGEWPLEPGRPPVAVARAAPNR